MAERRRVMSHLDVGVQVTDLAAAHRLDEI
jgi:hypothetical protein